MNRLIASAVSGALMLGVLTGCGLGETAATTAALAEAKVQEAKAAKETQAKLEQQLQDAQAVAAQQREAAEAASQ
jgi:alpha-D-ribose 1-methylphosphonate 5-triphosphate synthase subunit PhnG